MDNLRNQAEKILNQKKPQVQEMSQLEMHKLIEELQIHQIELQVQNAELRESRLENEASKKRYFNLFDLAPVGYIVLDEKAVIAECNLKASEIIGRRKEHLFNKPFVSLLDTKSMGEFYGHFENALTKRMHEPFELVIRKNNELRFVELAISIFSEQQYLMVLSDITEKKQIQEKLAESEDRYRNLVELADDVILMSDLEGNTIFRNNAYYTSLGFEPNENLEEGMSRIHPDDMVRVKNGYNDILEKEMLTIEYRVRHKSEHWIHRYGTSKLLKSRNGQPYAILSILKDVSGLKKVEQTLKESEERLRLLINSTTDVVFALDKDQKHIGVYGDWPERVGLSKDYFLGKTAREILGENAQIHIEANEKALNGEYVDYEWSSTVNNHTNYYQTSLSPLKVNGEITGLIGVGRDISALKKTEYQLKEKNITLELAMYAGEMAWWEMELPSGKVRFGQKKAEMLGYDPERFKHYNDFMTLVHPDDFNQAMKAMKDHLTGKTDKYETEYRIQENSGKYTWFYDVGSIVTRDKNGAPEKICGIAININERKKAENLLITAKEKAEQNEYLLRQQKEEIELNNNRLEGLLRISQYRATSVQELLDYALDEAIELTNSKIGYIYFYNEEKRQFELNTWSKEVMKECQVMSPQTTYNLDVTGCWGEAVRQRRPIIINDYKANHPHKKGTPEGHVSLSKFLTVPVFIDNEIVAVAGVANKESDYNESDVRELSLLMDSVWKISERITLIDKLKDSNKKLELSENELKERLKELNGIYSASLLIENHENNEEIYNQIVKEIIPESMQFPEKVYVVLELEEKRYSNIPKPEIINEKKHLSAPILSFNRQIGKLIVAYTENLPFIKVHEQRLIDAYAERISTSIERYNVQQTLKESESKFRNLVWSMQVGVLLQGPKAEILLYNPKALELMGLTEDQMTGKTSFDPDWNVIHEDGTLFPSVEHPVPQAIAARKAVNNVVMGVYHPKKGNYVWLHVDAEPQFYADGSIRHVVCSFIDITELKHAEKALKNSRSQLQLISDNVPALISQISHDLKFLFVNKKYEELYNLKKEDFIGKKIEDLLGKENVKENMPKINKVLNGEIVSYDTKRIKNDEPIYYNSTLIPNKKEGKTDGYFVLVIDITPSKIAEIKLKESSAKLKALNATKDKFFSIVSHDLKSPFASILGFSDLLVKNIERYDSEKIFKFAKAINNSSLTAFKLLEDLLAWANSQSDKIEFCPELINLNHLISDIAAIVRHTAKSKNIQINFDLEKSYSVFADKNMLNTILRNLVGNSIKFTPRDGCINIFAKENQDNIEITVSDNGVGMDENTLSKLFKISEKVSRKGTENESGTGLGLLLCKEFVEKHGGKIWAESELGKGSDFLFTLPLES